MEDLPDPPGSPIVRTQTQPATFIQRWVRRGRVARSRKSLVGELFVADVSVPPLVYERMGIAVGPVFAQDTYIRVSRNEEDHVSIGH